MNCERCGSPPRVADTPQLDVAVLAHRLILLLERLPRLHQGTPQEVRQEALQLVRWMFAGVEAYFATSAEVAKGPEEWVVVFATGDEVLVLRGCSLTHAQERRLAAIFVAQVGHALEAAADRETIRELGFQDALTGLPNRRALELDIGDSPPPDHRLFVIDIDGLKIVNDTQGHQAGDQLIFQVAQQLRQAAPASYRTGGDEFVALVASQQREAFEATLRTLPCSFGSLRLNDSWRDAYAAADQKMYADKRRKAAAR